MNVLIQASINIGHHKTMARHPDVRRLDRQAAVVGTDAAAADITPEKLDGFSALDMAATVECLPCFAPRRGVRRERPCTTP